MALLTLVVVWAIMAGETPKSDNNSATEIGVSVTPTPKKQGKPLVFEGKEYFYDYWLIEDISTLKLIPNYTNKFSSDQLMKEHACRFGINGGFYSADNKPLGRLVVDEKELEKERKSLLFNGFINVKSTFEISRLSRNDNYVLQTGPLLVENSRPDVLTLATDKPARRMVAVTDSRNKAMMMAIYSDISSVDGPLLAKLPKILESIGKLEKILIVRAINLDGGSASAFYSNDTVIKEWQPVGSWWCLESTRKYRSDALIRL